MVEDDEELRKCTALRLPSPGSLWELADGLSALTTLDREPVNLVVLDLGLPDISGLVIIQDIAAQAQTRHVPVLYRSSPVPPERLDHLDVACVLRKPISPDALVTAVLKCLGSDAG